jgi:DNA-binding NtrC family response regulator
VPPLRDRREDIPPLALHLLNRITAQHGLVRRISPQAMRRLLDYSWPGNVRELANVIEYAVAVARRETILPEDLPQEIRLSTPGVPPPPKQATVTDPEPQQAAPATLLPLTPEAEHLLAALEKHHWRRAEAAKALGLSRSTLWRRMRELHLG